MAHILKFRIAPTVRPSITLSGSAGDTASRSPHPRSQPESKPGGKSPRGANAIGECRMWTAEEKAKQGEGRVKSSGSSRLAAPAALARSQAIALLTLTHVAFIILVWLLTFLSSSVRYILFFTPYTPAKGESCARRADCFAWRRGAMRLNGVDTRCGGAVLYWARP